jgi:hypothetical protein
MHNSSNRTFDELGVEMVADFDLMKNITQNFVDSTETPYKLACLEELEFLVHHVDNAADFIQIGIYRHVFKYDLKNCSEIISSSRMFKVR